MIKKIDDLLAEAEKENQSGQAAFESGQSHSFLVGDRAKKHRESWVLGRFTRLYNQLGNAPFLLYAAPGDSDAVRADFAVFNSDKPISWVCDIEIAEVLTVGRRRDHEYKSPTVRMRAVSNAPANAGAVLKKKLIEKAPTYRLPTWLVVYRNVDADVLRQDPWGDPVKEMRAEVGAIGVADPIQQVWLLRSDGRMIERLHP